MKRSYVGFKRTFGVESTTHGASRKSKEERFELVVQFVSKYQALHSGKLPGITVLRKEVGGKYDTLKEILNSLKTIQHIGGELRGKIKGSSLVTIHGSGKQSVLAQKTSGNKIKKHADAVEADNVRYATAIQAVEQRAQKMGPYLDASRCLEDTYVSTVGDCNFDVTASDDHRVPLLQQKTPLKVDTGDTNKGDNGSVVTALEEHHMQSAQQKTLLKVAAKVRDGLNEFSLMLFGISGLTTPKDLREAFEDCGEIWNASLVRSQKMFDSLWSSPTRMDAIINFKTDGGLKAAMMKETVLLRGHMYNLRADLKLLRTKDGVRVSGEASQGTQIKYKDLSKTKRAR